MCLVSFSKTEDYSAKTKLQNFKSDAPKWAYIEITDACSHKCSWCYGGFDADLSNYMSYDKFVMIVEKCKEMGIVQITLSGGEPTEHPLFEDFVKVASKYFIVNIATHGDWKNVDTRTLKMLGVKQIQFNYQGKKRHDGVHKVDGSFERQQEAIKATVESGIDSVCTVTVGAYNLGDVDDIFSEINALGATRLRVWEATGFGNRFRKDKEAREIFEACKTAASKLGYNFVQSYDPEFDGDVGVKCLSLSKLFMYIKHDGTVLFCGAVPQLHHKPIADFNTQSPRELIENYNAFMDSMQSDKPYCAARNYVPINEIK